MPRPEPKKLYFGHPKITYGKPVEKKLLKILQKRFPDHKIINPNQPEHQRGAKKESWPYFEKMLDKTHVGVFFPLHNDSLGAGVVYEIKHLLKKQKKVFLFDSISGELKPVKELGDVKKHGYRILSLKETRELYKSFR
jgi:hypothetical protein